MTDSIRLIQRYDSFSRAFARLEELVNIIKKDEPHSLFADQAISIEEDIVREALIKRFEFTQELSWNLLKNFMQYQGETDLLGSRDVYRRALKLGIVTEDSWMNMIRDRNLSAHDYNDSKAKQITERIIKEYYPLFKNLHSSMGKRIEKTD